MKKDIHNYIFVLTVLIIMNLDNYLINDETIRDIISVSGFLAVLILFLITHFRFRKKNK